MLSVKNEPHEHFPRGTGHHVHHSYPHNRNLLATAMRPETSAIAQVRQLAPPCIPRYFELDRHSCAA